MFSSRISRMTTTTNFTKCRVFRDRAKSGPFLNDEETERRADRKFKWDLRQSLARKLIVITGADRPARLISWTIYDGPAARDRSPRSPNKLGIEDWSGAAKRDFQVCRWKWRTFRFASRRKLRCRHCDLEFRYILHYSRKTLNVYQARVNDRQRWCEISRGQ